MTASGDKFPVAIIGVGNMGAGMAQRLLAEGWPLRICDLDRAKMQALLPLGALAHGRPAQAALDAQVVIICVVDGAQTEAVLFGEGGLASVMSPGRVLMLCPTLGPDQVEDLARRLRSRGIETVDAPMSGGPARARDGSMSLMVACADSVFERHRGLFEALSSKVFRISERVGDGARTKLVNNLAAGINLVGASEVMVMAQRMGLDLEQTLRVIEQSSGQSWIGSDRLRRAMVADDAPRAHMTLLEKDTRLAVQAAQAAGFTGPLGATVRDVFASASAGGLDALDDSALFQWLGRPR